MNTLKTDPQNRALFNVRHAINSLGKTMLSLALDKNLPKCASNSLVFLVTPMQICCYAHMTGFDE